jgi:hypothetical protein
VNKILLRLPGVRQLAKLRTILLLVTSRLSRVVAVNESMLLDVELPSTPRWSDQKRLLQYQHRVNSQHGEDGMLREIFRRIGTTDRFFVEIGVGDGTENNTAFLLSTGWTGLWIDGDGSFVRNVEPRPDLRGHLKWHVGFITRENVAGLLQSNKVATEFDLLSVDIDQNTWYVWSALKDYRPRVVVIEYNSVLPADCDWKVAYQADRTWNGTHNFGASLKALENLGRALGYSLVGCDWCGLNAFFVRDDLLGDHFAAPYTAENHYEPPRSGIPFRPSHPVSLLDRQGD